MLPPTALILTPTRSSTLIGVYVSFLPIPANSQHIQSGTEGNVQSHILTIGPLETLAAVHRVNTEIDILKEQQAEALKMAVFVGLPPDEAIEYDQRHNRITKLLLNRLVMIKRLRYELRKRMKLE